jgi:hypothetical protein
MSWLPKISMGLTLDALAQRLRCAECGGPLLSVKPWRQGDEFGKRGQSLVSDSLRLQRSSMSVHLRSQVICLLSFIGQVCTFKKSPDFLKL